MFSGLSPLVIEETVGEEGRIRVRARTPGGLVSCPGCGVGTPSLKQVPGSPSNGLPWLAGEAVTASAEAAQSTAGMRPPHNNTGPTCAGGFDQHGQGYQ